MRLGRAFALHLAARGFDIALHYHASESEAEKTAEEIRGLGRRCALFQTDLGDLEGLEGFFSEVLDAFPHLTVLVNNASVYFDGPMASTTPERLRLCLNVNTAAPFMLTTHFAAKVSGGSVVNIIDNKVHFNQTAYAAYLLSKHALVEVTRMAAVEFAPGVRVNGIAPGVVMPAGSRSAEYVEWRIQGIPLRKQGDATDLTRALDYLLDSPFVTGQMLTVDGGEGGLHEGRHFKNFPSSP